MAKRRVAKRARAKSARGKRPPGPKPGTRSHRKLSYTPDMLADCRRRVEETDEPLTAIARDYGIGATTMYALVKSEGWRRQHKTVDLTPAMRLKAQVDAAFKQGDGSASRAEEAPGTLDALEHSLRGALTDIERWRAEAEDRGAKPADIERFARTLRTLTETLNKIERMRGAPQEILHADPDDDFPADIDAFRYELARRINEFVASRTHAGNPDGEGEMAVAPLRP